MIIYQGTTENFVDDVMNNRITDVMRTNFSNSMGREAPKAEFTSWSNSSQYLKNLIELGQLHENYICLEYPVPYTSERIDCLIFGKSEEDKEYMVLIELKQWSDVKALDVEGNFVETFTGGAVRTVSHPSQQVEGYTNHLVNFVEIFEYDKNFNLVSCSYCHNYNKEDGKGLFAENYKDLMMKYPIYTKTDVSLLAKRLKELLHKGNGLEIFNRFMQSPVRPSKKLLENTAKIISNEEVFSLLNEQIVAKNLIMSKVRRAEKNNEKSVIIVKGGPGTGKSVIALNVLAQLASKNKKIFFGCKSKPFVEAIKEKVGRNGGMLFTNLNAFLPTKMKENELDVLLIDEAHRIGKTSNHQFTSAEHRTEMPQIEQLIRCSKTTVFFIDDKQVIRSLEVGSTKLIKESAEKYGVKVDEVELMSQFRCNGSDNYLDWIESILGFSSTPKVLKKQDNFDFRIFSSPSELYDFLKKKEEIKANSARLTAGFCWEWSKTLDSEGNLVKDVKIGDFAMPWETHGDIKPPKGYVKWYEWAFKPEGIKQVGCIYTAQGFEFEYVGVIVGDDLIFNKEKNCLSADIKKTKDPVLKRGKDDFERYVKNIYRVLMSRGMKGCYVYFCNKEVEAYFRKFISSELLENFSETK